MTLQQGIFVYNRGMESTDQRVKDRTSSDRSPLLRLQLVRRLRPRTVPIAVAHDGGGEDEEEVERDCAEPSVHEHN
jgi:hypothetical protein